MRALHQNLPRPRHGSALLAMGYSRRNYRQGLCPAGMKAFTVTVKETDLWIAVDEEAVTDSLAAEIEQYTWQERRALEKYIQEDPYFTKTLEPFLVSPTAPSIALEMARAGNLARVGPMAAVAGAFAQRIGMEILRYCRQVIVENGGDIFLRCDKPLSIGVFAGNSPFSQQVALRIKPREAPRGICTSSGRVGPSFSRGEADAAVVMAKDALLADAVATETANRVQREKGLDKALEFARQIPGIEGVLIIQDDRLAAWGDIQLEEG